MMSSRIVGLVGFSGCDVLGMWYLLNHSICLESFNQQIHLSHSVIHGMN